VIDFSFKEIPTGVNIKSIALNKDDTFLVLVYKKQGDQAVYLGLVDTKIVNEEVEAKFQSCLHKVYH